MGRNCALWCQFCQKVFKRILKKEQNKTSSDGSWETLLHKHFLQTLILIIKAVKTLGETFVECKGLAIKLAQWFEKADQRAFVESIPI